MVSAKTYNLKPKTWPLVAIVGQTAAGKSDLAMKLAEKYNGEIICADSRTIYKDMDIGTAKPPHSDQKQIPHHLLNLLRPDQRYTVANFKHDAIEVIGKIGQKNKIPFLVGGSGLYIDAVIYDYQFSKNSKDKKIRPNTLILGIKLPRDELRKRSKARSKKMIEQGLVKEAQTLSKKYGWGVESMNTPAHRGAKKYLENKIPANELAGEITRGDMYLAKKQLTWFKRNKNIHWINSFEQADKLTHNFLRKFATIVA